MEASVLKTGLQRSLKDISQSSSETPDKIERD